MRIEYGVMCQLLTGRTMTFGMVFFGSDISGREAEDSYVRAELFLGHGMALGNEYVTVSSGMFSDVSDA